MKAMVLERCGSALQMRDRPVPRPGANQALIRVAACGVCRTDLHLVDGELPDIRPPIVPGHEIVGLVESTGPTVTGLSVGDRVGVPWLGSSCGVCPYCTTGHENLCDSPGFTGYTIDGGYAEYCTADARYVFGIPHGYDDAAVAPLLCAGLIGYRSYRMAGDARSIGLYGFGAAAHIIAQVAVYQGRRIAAFSRPGDEAAQALARRLGAEWSGGSDERPPFPLDAAIIFAPVGALVPAALRCVRKGGTVVCAGIHMSDIPTFPYSLLWGERTVRSVANLTRKDGEDFLRLTAAIPISTEVHTYALADANTALSDLRTGALTGAGVLVP